MRFQQQMVSRQVLLSLFVHETVNPCNITERGMYSSAEHSVLYENKKIIK